MWMFVLVVWGLAHCLCFSFIVFWNTTRSHSSQYQSQLQVQTSVSDFGGLHLSCGTMVMYATPPLLPSLHAQYLATQRAGLEYIWGKLALPLLPYFTAPSSPFTACLLTCKQLLLNTSSVCRASQKVPKNCFPLPDYQTLSVPPPPECTRCYLS